MLGFITPLATLHKFQGFADKFLATPAGGIDDQWLKLAAKLSDIELSLIYHSFSAANGGLDYGREWDAQASVWYKRHYQFLLKLARYQADGFATDTSKLWLQMSVVY